jgi:hypothetical protein
MRKQRSDKGTKRGQRESKVQNTGLSKNELGKVVSVYGVKFICVNVNNEIRYVNLKQYNNNNITCTDNSLYR